MRESIISARIVRTMNGMPIVEQRWRNTYLTERYVYKVGEQAFTTLTGAMEYIRRVQNEKL